MWPDGVVATPPPFDQVPGFGQGVEDLAVKQRVPEFSLEALVVTVLPWTARLKDNPEPAKTYTSLKTYISLATAIFTTGCCLISRAT